MSSVVKTLGAFPSERAAVARERSGGAYGAAPYLLAKLAAEARAATLLLLTPFIANDWNMLTRFAFSDPNLRRVPVPFRRPSVPRRGAHAVHHAAVQVPGDPRGASRIQL